MGRLLDSTRTRIRAAVQVWRSGGILVLVCRIFAYLWKECAWQYIKARNTGELVTRRVNGHTMYINLNDEGISKELAVYRTHEPVTTLLLQKEIRPGTCVVDIGANIGYYALLEAKLVGATGKVIAIEPVPYNMALLKRNVAANGYHNVLFYDVAIGPENGTARMYSSNKSNLYAMSPHSDSNGEYITVPLQTLDNMLENEKRIDYLQMDMEGYEVEAIKGMLGIIKLHRPDIFIELHANQCGHENAIAFLRQLAELGYLIKWVVDKVFNYPLVKSRKAIETESIDDLMIDLRIIQERAVLNIYLESTGH